MSKRVQSLPLPSEINILYPNITKYKCYTISNKLVSSYIKVDDVWKDNLSIEIASQEVEKSRNELLKAMEAVNASKNTST